MMHKHNYEALDRTMRDLMKCEFPFGGKVVVIGGDFKQILAVIRRASPAHVVSAAVNRARFWHRLRVLRLSINMRVRMLQERRQAAALANGATDLAESHVVKAGEWAAFCERVGLGTEPVTTVGGAECIRLPPGMCLPVGSRTLEALVDAVYGEGRWHDREWLMARGLLTPLVDQTDKLNAIVHRLFPVAEERSFFGCR